MHDVCVTLVRCVETVRRKNKWDFFFLNLSKARTEPVNPTYTGRRPPHPNFNADGKSLESRMGETGQINGTYFAPALSWGSRGAGLCWREFVLTLPPH